MTSHKIAFGLVVVALFVGSITAHAVDISEGYKAYQRGDYATALRVFRKLADQGNYNSQVGLGFVYFNGQGVTQDYVQAHMWFDLAATRGRKDAENSREKTSEQMTPAQIAEARRLAREWKPKGNKECRW